MAPSSFVASASFLAAAAASSLTFFAAASSVTCFASAASSFSFCAASSAAYWAALRLVMNTALTGMIVCSSETPSHLAFGSPSLFLKSGFAKV